MMLWDDAATITTTYLPTIAFSGFVLNVAFFDQEGPLYAQSTAVPIWQTAVLMVALASSGSRSSAASTTAAGLCVVQAAFFLISEATIAWPWSLVLFALFAAEARSGAGAADLPPPYELAANLLPNRSPSSAKIKTTRKTGAALALPANAAVLLVLGGLTWGSAVLGLGTLFIPYGRYGSMATVTLGNGRQQRLFWNCEGPSGGGPTHWLNADASHASADFWPLQREMASRGLRTCTFDKPGQGWSGDFTPDQAFDPVPAMALLFAASHEPRPFRLVGWGGGGEDMYRYALARPQDVSSLVFLDTSGDAVEWRSWCFAHPSECPDANVRRGEVCSLLCCVSWFTPLGLRVVSTPVKGDDELPRRRPRLEGPRV